MVVASERPRMKIGDDPSIQTDDDRYRLLVEAITDYAIYMLDVQGNVTSWNPGAQRFKGYAADEIDRKSVV